MSDDNEHDLIHVPIGPIGRLTPACTCGWYSPNWSHSDYERHIRNVIRGGEHQ